MPSPLESSCRARAICVGSSPGRPRRLRTIPPLVVKCPSRLILALMALRPALTRCWIMLRSKFQKGTRHVEEQLASGCCGIKVLLIKIQINAHGFEVLDGSQQIDQRATRPIDGPGHKDIELPAASILEHGVKARPLISDLYRQGGRLASRRTSWLRDTLMRMAIAPRLSRPTRWKVFLPMSRPIVATVSDDF
jgi:hypothetical protein